MDDLSRRPTLPITCRMGLINALVGLGVSLGLCGFAQAQIAAAPPKAECQLRLATPASVAYRGARSRGYETFDDLRHQERVQVVVLHAGEACNYVLVASSRNSPLRPQLEAGVGSGLLYEVKEDGDGRNLLTPDYEGSSDTRMIGAFGEGVGNDVLGLFVEVPPGQEARGGRYEDTVLFRLFHDQGGVLTLMDEKGMAVGTDVPSVIQASINGSGARQTQVDFGDLEPGASRSLGFTAQANVDFRVSLSSANAGRLKHDFANAYIPYRVRMNGRSLTLGSGGSPVAEAEGDAAARSYDFDVEIGDLARGAPAGHYTDTLTVTISTM